jgi:hypothetical protein
MFAKAMLVVIFGCSILDARAWPARFPGRPSTTTTTATTTEAEVARDQDMPARGARSRPGLRGRPGRDNAGDSEEDTAAAAAGNDEAEEEVPCAESHGRGGIPFLHNRVHCRVDSIKAEVEEKASSKHHKVLPAFLMSGSLIAAFCVASAMAVAVICYRRGQKDADAGAGSAAAMPPVAAEVPPVAVAVAAEVPPVAVAAEVPPVAVADAVPGPVAKVPPAEETFRQQCSKEAVKAAVAGAARGAIVAIM